MKNKPLTIGLIIAVVGIWAWIVFSIFDFTKSSDIVQFKTNKQIGTTVFGDSVKQEYVLSLNYKDPFLKKGYVGKDNVHLIQNNTDASPVYSKVIKPVVVDVKADEPLPVIQYAGRMQNAKIKKPLAILIINDTEYMMQEGDVHDGVLLNKILNDSVQLKFSKKVFYVRKN